MKLFTIKQTSKILGFSTNTIYKFVSEGTIKATRSGKQGRFRIPQASIEEYLGSKLPTKQELTPTPPPTPVDTRPPLALAAIRILLIIALILLIADIFINKNTPFITQIFRLFILGVFILLAYQFGGTRKK